MKKFISLILALCLLTSAAQAAFSDVSGHWAEAAIGEMAEKGAVNGFEDGSFRPDGTITRGQYAKIISELYSLPASENGVFGFDSVEWGEWYDPYALNFKCLVMEAFADNAPEELGEDYGKAFNGYMDLTRIEAAAGLLALTDAPALTDAEKAAAIESFTDKDEFSGDGATVTVAAMAASSGLMQGDAQGRFRPYDSVTRAEACVLLSRALAKKSTVSAGLMEYLESSLSSAKAKMAELAAGFMSEDKKNEDDGYVIAAVGGDEVYAGEMGACLLTSIFGTRLSLLLLMGVDFDQPYEGDEEEYAGMTMGDVLTVAVFGDLAKFKAVYQQAEKYGLIDDRIKAAAAAAADEFLSGGMGEIFASAGVSEYALEKALLMNILMTEIVDLLREKGLSEEQINAVAAEVEAVSREVEILDKDYFGIDEEHLTMGII